MEALKRYAQFYNVTLRDELAKDDVAALVARHFATALDVDEDDSIVSFIQRIRNGERNATKRSSDKDRKHAAAAAEKKRKKSNSRKRQRDHSSAASVASSNGSVASASSGSGSGTANGRDASASSDDRKHAAAPSASAGSSGPASSASGSNASAPKSHKKSEASKKKEKDNGEDNELYCICNLPSYGNMIACDGKKCPNPSQWYHLECVGFSDGRHPDTWLCPECDPKGFAAFQSSKKKKSSSKVRSKSPGSSK